MEHRTVEQLRQSATILPQTPVHRPFSKRERLMRWAELLKQTEGRVRAFEGTEYLRRRERDRLRQDGSALSVAFSDPVLRSQGLPSDRFGDAARFFGLSHRELHDIVCHCLFGSTVSPHLISCRVRTAAAQVRETRFTAAALTATGVACAGALTLAVIAFV